VIKSSNETSDPSVIFGYHRKPTMKEQGFDKAVHGLCPVCNKPIKAMGRMFVCTCTGKQIYLPSGKPIKRHLKS